MDLNSCKWIAVILYQGGVLFSFCEKISYARNQYALYLAFSVFDKSSPWYRDIRWGLSEGPCQTNAFHPNAAIRKKWSNTYGYFLLSCWLVRPHRRLIEGSDSVTTSTCWIPDIDDLNVFLLRFSFPKKASQIEHPALPERKAIESVSLWRRREGLFETKLEEIRIEIEDDKDPKNADPSPPVNKDVLE